MKKQKQNPDSKSNSNVDSNSEIILKIISVIGYVQALFIIFFGMLFLMLGFSGRKIFEEMPVSTISSTTMSIDGLMLTSVIMGILFVALGIFWVIIAGGLWRAKQWSRISAAILIALGIFFWLMMITWLVWLSIILLIIFCLMLYYLTVHKGINNLFKEHEESILSNTTVVDAEIVVEKKTTIKNSKRKYTIKK